MKCPNCDKNVSSSAIECKKCGYDLSYEKTVPSEVIKPSVTITTSPKVTTSKDKTQKEAPKKSPVFGILSTVAVIAMFVIPRLGNFVDNVVEEFGIEFNAEVKEVSKPVVEVEEIIDSIVQEDLIEDIKIEYIDYVNSLGTPYLFLEISNLTKYTLDLNVELLLYDDALEYLETKYGSAHAVEAESTVLLAFLNKSSASYDVELFAQVSNYYQPVDADLEVTHDLKGDQVIIGVRNVGTAPAEFVEGKILFYKDGQVVDYQSRYFVDDDYELKAGTIKRELFKTYVDYDDLLIYVHGTRSID